MPFFCATRVDVYFLSDTLTLDGRVAVLLLRKTLLGVSCLRMARCLDLLLVYGNGYVIEEYIRSRDVIDVHHSKFYYYYVG